MNDKKEGIKVNWVSRWLLWSLFFKGLGFRICPLAESFGVDEYDNVEEEGSEDKDDAAKDPNSKGSQSRMIRGGQGESRVEHVHQHLLFLQELHVLLSNFVGKSHKKSGDKEATACRIGRGGNQETYFRHSDKKSLQWENVIF